MPHRPRGIIIADASPLIALRTVHGLRLLNDLYSRTLTTEVVRSEVSGPLPQWLEVVAQYDRARYDWYRGQDDLDPGEASALALADEVPQAILLIDERKGRAVATRQGHAVVGALGLVIVAKRAGGISTGLPLIDGMRGAGLWMGEALYQAVRQRLEEEPRERLAAAPVGFAS